MFHELKHSEILELIKIVHEKRYWLAEIKKADVYVDLFVRLCKKH
jgi:hypothetical protein